MWKLKKMWIAWNWGLQRHISVFCDDDLGKLSRKTFGGIAHVPKVMKFISTVVAQSVSRLWLLMTLWTAARQASLSFPISWNLFKLISIESMMPSNHFILCHPLLLLPTIFPSIRVFSNELALCIRWPKYWSFSFSISPSEYSGLISFRIDWFDLLVWSPCSPRDSQESSPAPQFESINSSVLSYLYGPTLTSVHDYWKNHSFD